jgi:hypothetical protein
MTTIENLGANAHANIGQYHQNAVRRQKNHKTRPPDSTATETHHLATMFGGKKFVPPLLRKPAAAAPDDEPASKKLKLEQPSAGRVVRPVKLVSAVRKPLLVMRNAETSGTGRAEGVAAVEGYYNVLW